MKAHNALYLAGSICLGIGTILELRERGKQLRESDEIWEKAMSDGNESSSSQSSVQHSSSS